MGLTLTLENRKKIPIQCQAHWKMYYFQLQHYSDVIL